MEARASIFTKTNDTMDAPNQWHHGKRREDGRKRFGLIVAIVGFVFLLHNIFPGFWHLPSIRFGWPWILLIVGLGLGIVSKFRRNGWWILVIIGAAHIVMPTFFPDIPTHRIVWPALLVGFGLAMIFGKHDRRRGWKGNHHVSSLTNDSDAVNIDVNFGGRKEIVTSRAFTGGNVRATCSGVELNLASAESGVQTMVMDVQVMFASVEMVLPSHWDIQNEIRPTMGSVEDHRTIRTGDAGPSRPLLILRGSVTFGSVELKSY